MAIYLQINKNERIEIKPTIFPDKTSQVWKVPGIEDLKEDDKVYIYWVFEQEAELIWLCQLFLLISKLDYKHIDLIIPYLPYARQDKEVSNHSCFAYSTFRLIINFMAHVVYKSEFIIHILDAHSDECTMWINTRTINHIPYNEIKVAYEYSTAEIMLLPDEGAFNRYSQVASQASTHCVKDRDPSTGKINSITIPDIDFKDKRVLIVDDICDGGGTFIEIAKQLKAKEVAYIGLYVTHDLHTKGRQVLFDAGINNIYRTDYELFYQGIINE